MKTTRKRTALVRFYSSAASLPRPLRFRRISRASLRLLLAGICVVAVLGGSHAPFSAASADERRTERSCSELKPDWHDGESLQNRYEDAIKDARDIQPCERMVPLAVIRQDNPDLIWDASGTRVLVVNWTRENSKIGQQQPGTPFTAPPPQSGELWVTTVPTIREMLVREGTKLAAALPNGEPETQTLDATLRTKQYLGLPKDGSYSRFVEFWVRPQDLLRPCEYDVASDVQCGSTSAQPGGIALGSKPRPFSQEYPFTRLGYTYDWGNRITKVGATEFVVRPGSAIEVFRILSNADYLQCDAPDRIADPRGRILRTCF